MQIKDKTYPEKCGKYEKYRLKNVVNNIKVGYNIGRKLVIAICGG